MKRTNFGSASTGIQRPVRKLGAGLLMMGLALTASAKDGSPSDTVAPPSILSPVPTGNPILSEKLTPKARRHWLQVGVASWYGTKFQGRTTAGGERFDMYRMTCAHRSLPLGTWLRVTNLRNHRTTYVRVNDRGPVLEDRIVDLSFAAAQVLGLEGIGQVKLEAVNEGDPGLTQALVSQLQMPTVFNMAER